MKVDMGEIKFRAWLKDEKRMINWSPTFFSDMSPVTGYSSWFPDDPDVILMQYIGLKDENEKDGYFGDIVQDEGDRYIVEWDPDEGVAYLKSCMDSSIDCSNYIPGNYR